MILLKLITSFAVLGWLASYMVDKGKKRAAEKASTAYLFDNVLNIGWYVAVVWLLWT